MHCNYVCYLTKIRHKIIDSQDFVNFKCNDHIDGFRSTLLLKSLQYHDIFTPS